jgi:hypothetical protein
VRGGLLVGVEKKGDVYVVLEVLRLEGLVLGAVEGCAVVMSLGWVLVEGFVGRGGEEG